MSRTSKLLRGGPISRRRFLTGSLLCAGSLGAAAAVLFRGERGKEPVAPPGKPLYWVTSNERKIGFDDLGNVVALQRDDIPLPLAPRRSGLSLHDPVSSERLWVSGTMRAQRGAVVQTARLEGMGFSVEAVYRFLQDDTLEVDGWVADETGRDRVIDLIFSVPLTLDGTSWQPSLTEHRRLASSDAAPLQEHVPLALVGDIGDKYDLAFSIPPDHPVRFEIQPDPEGEAFSVRLKFGLSPAAGGVLRSRAPFRFALDILPAGAGLRFALDRYYARHTEVFASHVRRFGFWQIAPRGKFTRPQYYAFHETGYAGGKARSVDAYERNDGWGLDEASGVYTLAYTLVGQAEITSLAELPTDYDASMTALDEWNAPANPFGGPSPRLPNSYTDVDQHKAIIANCALHVSPNRLHLVRRTTAWGGNSVTFPLNPSPELGSLSPTIARYMLDDHVPLLLASASVDGVYVDSLEAWGNFYNYRRAHFATARIPLTYQADRRQPALFNTFSHQEYLWELRERLHAAGKILMGNGVSESRAFNGFALDVICAEQTFESVLNNEPLLAYYRTIARHKPVLLMIYDGWEREQDVARLWKWSLLYGFFASSGPQNASYVTPVNEVRYQDRFAPHLIRLASAGWQPRTGVSTADSHVRVERYGDGSHFFLVLYNTGPSVSLVTLQVDHSVVLRSGAARMRDVLSDEEMNVGILSGSKSQVAADEIRVLEIWETVS